MNEPAMTYAGTAGHSGTDTSKAQAQDKPLQGRTQAAVIRKMFLAGERGLTVYELRRLLLPNFHHGQISSALTNLHRAGLICRLAEKRGRAKVYVLPQWVGDRVTETSTVKPKPPTECPHCGGAL